MALLALADFKSRSIMPSEDVDALEAQYPGYVAKRLALREGLMNARLAKRYATPFEPASPPDVAVGWLVAMVTLDCYLRRGFNPSSAQDQIIADEAKRAETEILEAANSETGLFELPLRQDAPGASGVSKGGPFGYSEASPYVAFNMQRETARGEDSSGRGT